jgi:hypothetical protein
MYDQLQATGKVSIVKCKIKPQPSQVFGTNLRDRRTAGDQDSEQEDADEDDQDSEKSRSSETLLTPGHSKVPLVE